MTQSPQRLPLLGLLFAACVSQPVPTLPQPGTIAGRVVMEGEYDRSGVVVTAAGPAAAGASTDVAGAFRFEGLPAGTYVVEATAQATAEAEDGVKAVVALAPGETEEVALALTPAGALAGTVRFEDAGARAGVRVYLAGTEHMALTDAAGAYGFERVPTGAHAAAVSEHGYEAAVSEEVLVERGETARVPEIVLRNSNGALAGTVRLEDAGARAGVRVYLAGTERVALTDATGAYLFEEIPTGPHAVAASEPGYETAVSEEVVVERGETTEVPEIVLRLAIPPHSGAIVGTARYFDRAEHAGITVGLEGTDIETLTAADGSFRLVAPEGSYVLYARSPPYQPARVVGLFAAGRGTFEVAPIVLYLGRLLVADASLFAVSSDLTVAFAAGAGAPIQQTLVRVSDGTSRPLSVGAPSGGDFSPLGDYLFLFESYIPGRVWRIPTAAGSPPELLDTLMVKTFLFAPDGQGLAYFGFKPDGEPEIHLVRPLSGTPVRVEDGEIPRDATFAYSPRGLWLTYGNQYVLSKVVPADGLGPPIGMGSGMAFSPEEDWVCGSEQLVALSGPLKGSRIDREYNSGNPCAFSADGKWFVAPDWRGQSANLRALDLMTAEEKVLPFSLGNAFTFANSGAVMAVADAENIYFHDLDSGQLATFAKRIANVDVYLPYPINQRRRLFFFAPDGRLLYPSAEPYQWELLDRGSGETVTLDASSCSGPIFYYPTWDPSAKHIAAYGSMGGCVFDATTGEETLTGIVNRPDAFSPDDRWVVLLEKFIEVNGVPVLRELLSLARTDGSFKEVLWPVPNPSWGWMWAAILPPLFTSDASRVCGLTGYNSHLLCVLLDDAQLRTVTMDTEVGKWAMAPDGRLVYEVVGPSPRAGVYAIP